MRILLIVLIVLTFGPANAEMVKIPWHTSTQSSPWIPGNDYIDGWSKSFMNGTIEEKGKVKANGELQAEIIRPKVFASTSPRAFGGLAASRALPIELECSGFKSPGRFEIELKSAPPREAVACTSRLGKVQAKGLTVLTTGRILR